MQTLAIAPRLNLAVNILKAIEAPLTVSHIRETWETEEIDHLIGKANVCKSFEFNDLNYSRGYLAIEYNVVYADGYKERVSAGVSLNMTMKEASELVIKAIFDADQSFLA